MGPYSLHEDFLLPCASNSAHKQQEMMNSIAVISNSVFLDRDKSAFQFFHYFRGFIPIRCNRVNNLLTGP